jgi:DNA-binding protein HU-beta
MENIIMNKTELVASIASESGLTKADAARALEATVSTITKAMSGGDSVAIIGFGTFKVGDRAARTGRNPQTGAAMQIPAAKVPKFSAGKGLKEAVNGK